MLPQVEATAGHGGLVVAALREQADLVTYDPGFMNTAATASAITFVDGKRGILRYRGYPIEALAEHATFLEVAYLLIYGELPDAATLADFSEKVNRHTLVPEQFRGFLAAFPRGGHPMSMMASTMNALATFYPEALNPHDPEAIAAATVLILAKMRTITSYIHRSMRDEPLLYPDYARGYVEDLLRMTFGVPYQQWNGNPVTAAAMDKLLILQADHEQNCSTSTVRLVGSAHTNLFSSVAAGINALSGPLHGGANESALAMLERIRSGGDSVAVFMRKVKDKEDGVRLMGFGHRVYKSYDPRAAIIKEHAHAVLDSLDARDELFDIALGLEEIALSDDYFIERRLYPNVDFYSGLIYRAIGYSPAMFTPLFALARMPGWIAQWREMMRDPATRIGRPHQIYTGHILREFVPLAGRGD
ncbi:MAG: citrate synthase [Promicromonosporaceae bacterium]|nr:citrate synthase [Promicromonosporaceae bacterium]